MSRPGAGVTWAVAGAVCLLSWVLEDYARLLHASGRESEAVAIETRLGSIRAGRAPASGSHGGAR